ncbi:hypothetical protein [Capnocytophaga sp. oral taxon 878]|uniref:hypothetical protein n=1 Tax=Capnocytophaga sp. oral taxon 878 TaxID=1316596 RepID=UPI000D039A4E|nr:hypothetical protein [Capnocytophaga sp. oral taxon 878]AVM50760.1 hypothetical protein C4H12_09930 [Capnocytophaga sp. oral taxon 878]
MQINDFLGKTFVAFVDISGFKAMMNKNTELAAKALDHFYQTGYETLQLYQDIINGIFISDCGVLFVREREIKSQLEMLLDAIKEINKKMLEEKFMLTTNIAYGDFGYQNRVQFEGISKNLLYGNAYLDAYLDSINKPKIEPGLCRILKPNIDDTSFLDANQFLKKKGKHYYYYWSVNAQNEIDKFEQDYKNAKYEGILRVLKGTF